MWLAEKLNEKENKVFGVKNVQLGGVKPVLEDKGKVNCVFPYGLCYALQSKENAVCAENFVIGVIKTPENIPLIENGEVCLYSKGGYIHIKNNGDVIINGKKLNI